MVRTAMGEGQDSLLGGPVTVSAAFEGSAEIAEARQLARSFLTDVQAVHGLPVSERAMGMVQLVVSELVTNAVKHAGGPCGIELRVLERETVLEIAVWDGSARAATVTPPDPERVGRHGMEIVTALCGGFEVTPIPEGKRITVRMALRPAPAV